MKYPVVKFFSRTSTSRKRGVVLVIFAISLLIIFALAALAIDMGILRLTQRQMQTASDGAAIRGLQLRDAPVDRRAAASEHVAHVFDDDFDTAADSLFLGAGPTYTFTSMIPGDLDGGTIVSTSVYDPELLPNPANLPHGDMLSGNYDPTQRHDEGYNLGNYYERDDFPSGFDELNEPTPPNSFLVRLRRTRNATGLDLIPNVSSSGPSIPLIYGRGAAIGPGSTGFDARAQGFSISSVSIADAQPSLSVGPEYTSALVPPNGIPGLSYYALDVDFWAVLTENVWVEAAIFADGSIVGIGATSGGVDARLIRRTQLAAPILAADASLFVTSSNGFPAVPFTARVGDSELVEVTAVNIGTGEWTIERGVGGSLAAAFAANTPIHLFETQVITDLLPASLPVEELVPTPGAVQYVPLFQQYASGERVTAFGAALMRPLLPLPNPIVFPVAVEIQRLPSQIPELNHSAKLGKQLDPALSAADINTIFAERNSVTGAVRSPALVRSY
ncbi:MAG: pilus assembly protein TadG-related protein [Sumerlaeia bacterium]